MTALILVNTNHIGIRVQGGVCKSKRNPPFGPAACRRDGGSLGGGSGLIGVASVCRTVACVSAGVAGEQVWEPGGVGRPPTERGIGVATVVIESRTIGGRACGTRAPRGEREHVPSHGVRREVGRGGVRDRVSAHGRGDRDRSRAGRRPLRGVGGGAWVANRGRGGDAHSRRLRVGQPRVGGTRGHGVRVGRGRCRLEVPVAERQGGRGFVPPSAAQGRRHVHGGQHRVQGGAYARAHARAPELHGDGPRGRGGQADGSGDGGLPVRGGCRAAGPAGVSRGNQGEG